ncbi:MAG: hypothetical protein ABGZ53_25115, partial [Fuerstiella sp.]
MTKAAPGFRNTNSGEFVTTTAAADKNAGGIAAHTDVADLPALSTKKEVAGPKFLNCSTRHVEKLIERGKFPRGIRCGANLR